MSIFALKVQIIFSRLNSLYSTSLAEHSLLSNIEQHNIIDSAKELGLKFEPFGTAWCGSLRSKHLQGTLWALGGCGTYFQHHVQYHKISIPF